MAVTTPKSEYSTTFWNRMKNAMGVSFHKYGLVRHAYPHKVDAIGSLKTKLDAYLEGDAKNEPGNKDLLVDIANYAMIEFMFPAHENSHDEPKDGSTGRKWHSGGRNKEHNNAGDRQRSDI